MHRFGCAPLLQKETTTEQEQALLCTVLKELPSEMIRFYVKALQSLLFNRVVQWRVQIYGKQVLLGDLVLEEGKVRYVSQGDLDAHHYSISDVVIPLFGYVLRVAMNCRWEVVLPENAVGEEYDSILRDYLGCSREGLKSENCPVRVRVS